MTVVKRGDVLRQIAMLMRERRDLIAGLVARETGKSKKDALGETDAAIEMGFFVAGEGRRFTVRRPRAPCRTRPPWSSGNRSAWRG